MNAIVPDGKSRLKYWYVELLGGRRYPFPTEQAAELFAENHNGAVFKPTLEE